MGTDGAEPRFSEALEEDEEKQVLKDPGELCEVRLHPKAEVFITVVLLDYDFN